MRKTVLWIVLLIYPVAILAHTLGGSANGFLTGISHPVVGYDHLLAMLSVGAISAQLGGRAVWVVPLTFMTFMVVGGLLGINHIALISVEIGIAVSVIVLGAAMAIENKVSFFIVMLFVGFFAVFHGHAHGVEMPGMVKPGKYVLGFILGTGIIHLLGMVLAFTANALPRGSVFLRLSGVAIACVGVRFLMVA